MPKPSSTRYRTTNWPDYNAALRRRRSLFIWFDPTMAWHAAKTGKRGHPETFSDSTIQTCLTLKVLFGLPLRQTVGLIEMAGLGWTGRFRTTPSSAGVRPGLRCRYLPPLGWRRLPVDSTGIKFRGDGEWEVRKVHIGMDARTGDVRAVAFTSSRQGDSLLLPDLLARIPEDDEIGSVTADGAYDTRRAMP